MKSDFEILSAITVPSNYTWDAGIPLQYKTTAIAYTNTQYASGYSPGLKVYFKNKTILNSDYDSLTYEWNFGDYYNLNTNTLSLTSNDPITIVHLYTIPGKYNVSLKVTQTKQTTITTVFTSTHIKTQAIEVKEIPPIAKIHSITKPTYGVSPLTVELSPEFCKLGSFPIDRIDFDFDDGSEIKTITRYSLITSDPYITHTNTFTADPLDVRNYVLKHTFYRNKNTHTVFYPSLTCYSDNTDTSDSCCTTIGPLFLSATPVQINILKTRNSSKGNLYVMNVNDNLTFLTNSISATPEPRVNVPKNLFRDSYGECHNKKYQGNLGINYPA